MHRRSHEPSSTIATNHGSMIVDNQKKISSLAVWKQSVILHSLLDAYCYSCWVIVNRSLCHAPDNRFRYRRVTKMVRRCHPGNLSLSLIHAIASSS